MGRNLDVVSQGKGSRPELELKTSFRPDQKPRTHASLITRGRLTQLVGIVIGTCRGLSWIHPIFAGKFSEDIAGFELIRENEVRI